MNIKDRGMWPEDSPPALTVEAWAAMLRRRRSTFNGFLAREAERGIVQLPASLAQPRGQDYARLFMWRCIEEWVEAQDSNSTEHVLEELIDAVNYALSILLIDEMTTPIESSAEVLYEVTRAARPSMARPKVIVHDVGLASSALGMACDLFRNRSWMANPQDVYFVGTKALVEAVVATVDHALSFFESWDEFWRFYIAKDNVLQFRLRSNY